MSWPVCKIVRGDVVFHSYMSVYALPTPKQNERVVECVNAMEPGGKVEELIVAARQTVGILERASGIPANALREALKPFPTEPEA